MNKKEKTIDSYNKSAKAIGSKFDELGVRVQDIVETFDKVKISNPKTIEIGCGNGRDAQEIVKHSNNYLGFDISKELVALAREKVPAAKFIVADVEKLEFEPGIDIVFAFASLLHVDKENLSSIFNRIYKALNNNGLFRISLKYSDQYQEVEKEDQFGTRTFYFYSKEDINKLVGLFKVRALEIKNLRGQMWMEVLLQK